MNNATFWNGTLLQIQKVGTVPTYLTLLTFSGDDVSAGAEECCQPADI